LLQCVGVMMVDQSLFVPMATNDMLDRCDDVPQSGCCYHVFRILLDHASRWLQRLAQVPNSQCCILPSICLNPCITFSPALRCLFVFLLVFLYFFSLAHHIYHCPLIFPFETNPYDFCTFALFRISCNVMLFYYESI